MVNTCYASSGIVAMVLRQGPGPPSLVPLVGAHSDDASALASGVVSSSPPDVNRTGSLPQWAQLKGAPSLSIPGGLGARSGVGKPGCSRQPHKLEIVGSNPTTATQVRGSYGVCKRRRGSIRSTLQGWTMMRAKMPPGARVLLPLVLSWTRAPHTYQLPPPPNHH